MKTILVTGGAGYIGSHTVRELIKQKYDVVVLDSLENGHRAAVDAAATLEVADLGDKSAIDKIFDKYHIDAVIDFAAYLAVGESMTQPEKYLKNNVLNFINLLNVMAEHRRKYIIKSSTAAVYGNPTKNTDIPWEESFTNQHQPSESALLEGLWNGQKTSGEHFFQQFIDQYHQLIHKKELMLTKVELTQLRISMSIYGLSKLLDEIIMKKYDEMSSIKFVALRYFNVCGAHPDGDLGDDKPNPTNLMSVATMQLAGKIPEIKIFGRDYDTPDGTGVRDYIHPCDLAVGHIKALRYIETHNTSQIINLGTGGGASVMEVIEAVNKASGRIVKTVNASRRSGDPDISISDPSKAKQLLNWQAKYNLADMANTAWKWHSKHPEGFKQ